MSDVQISPDPTEEEAVAVAAALTVAWPAGGPPPSADPPRWRFSGRWWTQPIPMRRRRPW